MINGITRLEGFSDSHAECVAAFALVDPFGLI